MAHLIFGFDMTIRHENGVVEPIVRGSDSVRLMQIYSGGVVAVFAVFTCLYAHAYRRRSDLGLDPAEVLLTRVGLVDNAGYAAIGLLSVAIATIGGPNATGLAGFTYFLIGPFKFALGSYAGREQRRILESHRVRTPA